MNTLFRAVLTINSLSYFAVLYLLNKGIPLPCQRFGASAIVYVLVPIIMAVFLFTMFGYLSMDTCNSIPKKIEIVNSEYLPIYLGYFFVALSIGNWVTFCVVFFMLFIFIFNSYAICFNPLFTIADYKFYKITKDNDEYIYVISKRKLIGIEPCKLGSLARINDCTFFECKTEEAK